MKKIVIVLLISVACFLPNIALADSIFYTVPEGHNIEFRIAEEENSVFSSHKNWPVKYNIRNKPYYISPNIELTDRDIVGFIIEEKEAGEEDYITINGERIEATNYDENRPYQITILFKKEAWEKVRDLTKFNLGSDLAILKDDKVFLCPKILDVIDTSTIITNIEPDYIELFVDGLMISETPSLQQRDTEYDDWLLSHLYDPEYESDLSSLACDDINKEDYLEAIFILEKLLEQYPERKLNYFILGQCYREIREYDKCITFDQSLLASSLPLESELMVRIELGYCYIMKEQTSLALEQYRQCIELLEKSDFPNKYSVIDQLRQTITQIESEPGK